MKNLKYLLLNFVLISTSFAGLKGILEVKDFDGPIEDFVISIDNGPKKSKKGKTILMGQKDKQFSPQVKAIHVKEKVDFKNYDDIFHNVFSVDPGHKFDLGVFKGNVAYNDNFKKKKGKTSSVKSFKNAGEVNVFCNLHPSMKGKIYIFDHPWFSQVNEYGEFKIDLPAKLKKLKVKIQSPHLKKPKIFKINLDKINRAEPIKLKISGAELVEGINHTKKDGSEYTEEEIEDEDLY